MRLVLLLVFALLAGSATPASARYYFSRNGSLSFAGNVEDAPRAAPRRGTERVFFTRASGFHRNGYECIPLIEIALVQGHEIKRAGTICRDQGI